MLGGVRICAVNRHFRDDVPTLIPGFFVCFRGESCYVQVFPFTRFLNICFKLLQLPPSLFEVNVWDAGNVFVPIFFLPLLAT